MHEFSTTPPPTVTIAVRRPPLWSTGLTLLGTIAAACTLTSLADILPRLLQGKGLNRMAIESLGLAVFCLLWLGLAVAKRMLVRMKKLAPITFESDHVLIPRGAEALGSSKLQYDEIMAVNEGGRPPQRHFFVESTRRVFHLPQEMFVDLDGPEHFFLELRRRIMSLPQGGALLERTERERRAAVLAMNARPWATQALLGCIAVFFLNTELKGALDAPFGLLRWGANAAALVHQGEYYRLFAANFLHGGKLHVIMNGLALYYLGTLLERLLGWARFLVIYLTSGFAAMLTSALTATALMSVGASGSIFGLLGGFAVVSWRLRAQLPLGLRQTPRWWVSIVLINGFLPFLVPVVDVAAHLGGFVTGAAVTAAFVALRRALPPPANPFTVALAGAWVAAFVAALGVAVVHAANTDPAAETEFAELLLRDKTTDPQTLNIMAYMWAYEPNSTHAQLLAAEASAEEAVRREPNVAQFQDTVALAASRLGNVTRAIQAEVRALSLENDNNAFSASQLATFLVDPNRPVQDALVPNEMALQRIGEHWQLAGKKPAPQAGILYVVLMQHEHPAVLVQAKLGRGAAFPVPVPSDVPADEDFTARTGIWVPDPSAEQDRQVSWHGWKFVVDND